MLTGSLCNNLYVDKKANASENLRRAIKYLIFDRLRPLHYEYMKKYLY